MGLTRCLAEAFPYVGMVTVEALLSGLATLGKAALSRGVNRYAYIFYSHVLSTLILFALSVIFQRKERPPLTFSLLTKFFFISLIGITINQIIIFAGLDYSSPVLGFAMRNLIPAFTFLLAVVFRMEKLNLRSSRSQIKIIATLVSISGALTVTLYKGFPIVSLGDKSSLKSFLQSPNIFTTLLATERNWTVGGILFAASSLCIALWITAQGPIVEEYPAEITIGAFYFLFGTIQSAAVSFVAGIYQPDAWTIRPDLDLLSVICSGVGLVIMNLMEIWCIHKKGPVFVAMFKPLGIAIAAIMSIIFLGETLHIGTILGSIIVIIGFYGVMWAKSKENEEPGDSKDDFLPSSSEKIPLLQNSRDV